MPFVLLQRTNLSCYCGTKHRYRNCSANEPIHSLYSLRFPFQTHFLAIETKSIHRTSNSLFRDIINLPLLSLGLSYLPSIQSPDDELILNVDRVYIVSSALRLINAVMSFDYLGSQSDGESEEVCLIQLPSSWSTHVCNNLLPPLLTSM